MPPVPFARPIGAATIFMALGACGYAGSDEIETERVAILARVPIGTPFTELPAAMRALGFSCMTGRQQFIDANGQVRHADAHLSCEREQSEWLVCSRRTRAILLQTSGRLSEALVNVGHFCG